MFLNKLFHRKYSMNMKAADTTLKNVFAACEKKPSEIPFDKLLLRNKLNLISDNICIIIVAFFLALTLVAPVFFPHSDEKILIFGESCKELVLIEHKAEGDTFIMTFDGSPVDTAKSYMSSSDGAIVLPKSYDKTSNTISFDYNRQEYNIYIYDTNGNLLHLLLSPRE